MKLKKIVNKKNNIGGDGKKYYKNALFIANRNKWNNMVNNNDEEEKWD